MSANPQDSPIITLLAAALGFKGKIGEAKSVLAEAAIKSWIQPVSFARFDAAWTNWNASPEYVELRRKTIDVGLRRAGMPDE